MKRNVRKRLDRLESESAGRLSPAEYWKREICDDLEAPTEPWEQWFRSETEGSQ